MNRNKFSLDNKRLTTQKAGDLVPIYLREMLPGDQIRLNVQAFMRLMPLIAPVFSEINLKLYFYFVPYRLIWDDAEEFFTRGKNFDSTLTIPRIVVNDTNKTWFVKGSLPEKFGIPPTDAGTVDGSHYFNILPIRAYLQVWNDHFRNQEVQDEYQFSKSSADLNVTVLPDADLQQHTVLKKKNYEKDYFTGAKTRGGINPELTEYIPVQPVEDGVTDLYKQISNVYTPAGANPVNGALYVGSGQMSNSAYNEGRRVENLNAPLGIDIDDIRRASALKRWMEAIILSGGYRYKEYAKAIWDVNIEDYRIQISEFIGGTTIPVRISEVLNTSDTANAVQGEMAGHGVAAGEAWIVDYNVKEHGFIIGLSCVEPDATYSQGVESIWKKFDHMDYANPFLDELGAQEIPSSEIYYNYTDTEAENAVNFGYKPRFAEYKESRDLYCGEFRDVLRFWHFGREFGGRPTLSDNFVSMNDVRTDMFPDETGDHYLGMYRFNVDMLRPLSYTNVPRI